MFITETILMLVHTKIKKNEIIYQENKYPNYVYFILEGRVNCINNDKACFKNFIQESYFGEIEIIKNHKSFFLIIDK